MGKCPVHILSLGKVPSAVLAEQARSAKLCGSAHVPVCLQTLLSEWAEVCGIADSATFLPSAATSNESSLWPKDDLLFLAVHLG